MEAPFKENWGNQRGWKGLVPQSIWNPMLESRGFEEKRIGFHGREGGWRKSAVEWDREARSVILRGDGERPERAGQAGGRGGGGERGGKGEDGRETWW